MMLPFLIGLMLVFGAIPTVICFRRGRLDAGKMQYQALCPPAIMAAILTALLATVMLAGYLLFGNPHIPTGFPSGEIAFAFLLPHCFVFVFTLVVGMVAYSFGHISNSTSERAFRNDGPTIRVKETGNPYQPPAT